MKAVRMTSCSASDGRWAGDGEDTSDQTLLPASSFSAATRVASAASRFGPYLAEFSISSSETTSAPRALIALTVFACWRSRLVVSHAPRGPSPLQLFTVIGVPARSLYDVQVLPAVAVQSAAVWVK